MPKVNEKYFENKKSKILDAAFSVCMKKPVYDVTMSDIITETGFSQGGIYKYYSNLDDILIALINRDTVDFNIKETVDEILKSSNSPELAISELLEFYRKVSIENIASYGKIYYELTAKFAAQPERFENFHSKVTMSADIEYLQRKSFEYIAQKIEDGYFTPKLPMKDIITFLITSIDGIERDTLYAKCYRLGNVIDLDSKSCMRSLCMSVIFLLGGNS